MTARRLQLRINRQPWHVLLGVAVFTVLTHVPGVAAHEHELDRSDFGYNSIPIWTPLTSFERTTLDHISNAGRADADTLLALYLLASGDIRGAV
jgi:hypothetical protein